MYVVSAYFDILDPRVCPKPLEKLLRATARNGIPVILMADANAHSTLWGCTDNNARGETLEELLFQYNLAILNEGSSPTFVNHLTTEGTRPDITICSPALTPRSTNWRIESTVSGSDHSLILFDLHMGPKLLVKRRDFRKGDWSKFSKILDKKPRQTSTAWSIEDLERETETLIRQMEDTLKRTHPPKLCRSKVSEFRWWSAHLSKLYRQLTTAQNHMRRNPSPANHQQMVECRRAFKKEIRKAKRQSWQQFCADAADPKAVSLFTSLAKGADKRQLGLLKSSDGNILESPEASLTVLVDTHFPGNTSSPVTGQPGSDRRLCDITHPDVAFINETTVTAAIKSFGSHKAPGPDGFPPCVYKHFGSVATSRLTTIYKASFLLGYTPDSWRNAKVIFIPKPGKDDYTSPRSYRPITLSSVMLKIMERVVQRDLEESSFRTTPLHTSQHAFRVGRSTDTALSQLVDTVEEAFSKKKYALGVFLDIQGAFDNVIPARVIEGLTRRGVAPRHVSWYKHYLYGRRMSTEYKGVSIQRHLTLGTPQGGVLSPLMWNVCFDSLLHLFDQGPVRCVGFADDGALITTGSSPKLLAIRMQEAIDKATWTGEIHKDYPSARQKR